MDDVSIDSCREDIATGIVDVLADDVYPAWCTADDVGSYVPDCFEYSLDSSVDSYHIRLFENLTHLTFG